MPRVELSCERMHDAIILVTATRAAAAAASQIARGVNLLQSEPRTFRFGYDLGDGSLVKSYNTSFQTPDTPTRVAKLPLPKYVAWNGYQCEVSEPLSKSVTCRVSWDTQTNYVHTAGVNPY